MRLDRFYTGLAGIMADAGIVCYGLGQVFCLTVG